MKTSRLLSNIGIVRSEYLKCISHIRKLAESCKTYEQLNNVFDYRRRLDRNLRFIEDKHRPCLYWSKTVYDGEISFTRDYYISECTNIITNQLEKVPNPHSL